MSAPSPPLSERASFWRDAELPGVNMLTARYVTHRFLPHAHDSLVLGVIERGAESFRYRGARVLAPVGSVVVIPPGEVHTGEAGRPGGWDYRVMYLQPHWIEAVGGLVSGGFTGSVLTDSALASAVRRAQLTLTHPHASPLVREIVLQEALTLLLARYADTRSNPSPTHAPDAVRSVQARLDAHPEQAVSLTELALGVGLSPAHLARTFRSVVGVAPHTYQMTARVGLARDLLDAGETPASAALLAGFADQAHLNRVFKRVVGVPPGLYRRTFAARP
ncbi:AraC family transcriptional regulator [Deinococcus sp. QL22]|uniref:AraC family transcriptional regulator n=1 Tax=Deinococcus sp. QL22 TaxID=2939437 RepID=UPI002017280E|nr:AraC family transcriptional regulator [Deinococcus sp. QL22]UQN05028.1 AraC family transcriptional regulator [Deinococcus sp. QL22]